MIFASGDIDILVMEGDMDLDKLQDALLTVGQAETLPLPMTCAVEAV